MVGPFAGEDCYLEAIFDELLNDMWADVATGL